jgi:hypothetical protein
MGKQEIFDCHDFFLGFIETLVNTYWKKSRKIEIKNHADIFNDLLIHNQRFSYRINIDLNLPK